jgi:hypothetical protein
MRLFGARDIQPIGYMKLQCYGQTSFPDEHRQPINRQWPASDMVTYVTHHALASCHDSGATGLPHLRPFHGRIHQSSAEF